MQTKLTLPAILVAILFIGVLAAPPIANHQLVEPAAAQPVYKPHSPIKITHNNDFRATTAGVVQGHGTSSDPYIIEGWEFTDNASNGEAAAIWITGTSAYFVIRNCKFNLGPNGVAIQFDDMSNGVITDSVFTGGKHAIQVARSGALTIQVNTIEGSSDAAVVLIETGNTQVKRNTFRDNALGDIRLQTTDKGQIVENQFQTKGIGVDFDQGANFKLLKNTFNGSNGTIGARLDGMDAGEIKENKFTGFNEYGLQMLRSNRAIIQDNEFTQNGLAGAGAGIVVEQSSSMQLIANKANNNAGRGVYLIETSQSWIKDGEANNNGNDGIELRYSSNDGIRKMQAKDNQRAGINLNESSSNLVEENTVTGNRVRNNGSIIVGGNNNKVVRNEVANNAGYGILITQWMSGNQILANNVHDNGRQDISTDADWNLNIISDEEVLPQDEERPRGQGGLPIPAAPWALVVLSLIGLAFALRRRRA